MTLVYQYETHCIVLLGGRRRKYYHFYYYYYYFGALRNTYENEIVKLGIIANNIITLSIRINKRNEQKEKNNALQ